MKLYCVNENDCAHSERVSAEDVTEKHFTEPYAACPECGSLAIHIPDDIEPNSVLRFYKEKLQHDSNE